MVYLVQARSFSEIASNYSGLVLDSAAIDANGRFVFTAIPQTEGKALFQLCIQKTGNRFTNQLLEEELRTSNYMPVVLQKGFPLEFTADAARFQASFSILHPSAENQALLTLRDIRHKAYQQEQQWLDTQKPADENTLLDHEAALLRFQQPLMAFADSCKQFWPALVATRWVSPSSDYERVPEFLFRQCEKWQRKLPGNPWAAQLCSTGNREKLPLLIDDKAPNFPLPMQSGDTLSLYAVLGRRITILDIWASWCAPCRRENRDVLSPLWTAYQDQGLQILGYSIDSSPAAWKAAIAKDGAAWLHASHLSGDETPFLQALRINTIPANFILDAQGVVLAKNLHGEALQVFVANYLK